MFLNRAVQIKDEKFEDLINVMIKKLKPMELVEIFSDVKDLWNEKDDTKQLQNKFDTSAQNQQQAHHHGYLKPMTRAGSRNLLKTFGMERANSTNSKISDNQYARYNHMQIVESNSYHDITQTFKDTLVDNFTTTQQELDQFI